MSRAPRPLGWLIFTAGLLWMLLAACAPQGTPLAGDEAATIVGRVVFPAYHVQATIGDVASASTVVVIDATTNVSQGTTLTDAQGNFSLTFSNRYKPVADRTYYLEAVKGLDSNLAGKDAARVRTLIQYSGGWKSLTSAIAGSPIFINEGTTALSVIASHKGAVAVPPGSLIGKLTVSPEVFTPVPNVSSTEFDDVRGLVNALLLGDADPVAGIAYTPGPPGRFYPLASGSDLSVTPTTCDVNQTLTLQGITFDPTLTNNAVTFNGGVAGVVTGISPDRQSLFVVVPAGATTGPVTVELDGHLYGIPSLTISGTLNAGLY